MLNVFKTPTHLHDSSVLLGVSSVVPKQAGLYGFYFRQIRGSVPTEGCVVHNGATLLYVGIAPSSSSSSAHLRSRLRQHLRGNAYGSTLRLTLGCLLSRKLGLELRRTRSGKRRTFGPGEEILSEWIAEHAQVVFVVSPEPWSVERTVVTGLCLPLNLEFNEGHSFHSQLSELRGASREKALSLPCWAK